MHKTHRLSRRAFSRTLGVAAGAAVVPAGIAATLSPTPRQVEGPFYPVDDQADRDIDLTRVDGRTGVAAGETILVRGRVVDTAGKPIGNAVVDVWQANAAGRYSHPDDPNLADLDPNFQGWAVMQTRADGGYGFRTIKPGSYPLSLLGGAGQRCRHIHFKIACPGRPTLITQMYFDGDPLIEQDTQIAKVPRDQWHRLIAQATTDEATNLPVYDFEIVVA